MAEEARNQIVFVLVRYLVLFDLWDHCQIELLLVGPCM